MDPLTIALLAMQAAGMVVDWYGTRQQIELGRMGQKIEEAGINANIALTRAQAEEQSLRMMQQLRQALGTQAAMMAARGTRGNAGSAVSIRNESVKAFNDDERALKMNELAKEAELKAKGVMSYLHEETYENQLNQQLRQRFFDKIPTSKAGWNQMFGGSGTTQPSTNSRPGGNYGYGMTPV